MFWKINSYTGAPRVEDLKAALAIVSLTHHERMRKMESLRNDVQMGLDHIANLKKIEDNYLRTLGLLPPSPIGSDGSPTRNPYATLPDLGINSRTDAPSRVQNKNFTDYAESTRRPQTRPSTQDVNVSMNKVLEVLINEDSTVRRIEHKIRNAFLMVNLKREELRKLQSERELVAYGEGA